MRAPRLEINLDKIHHNARRLVGLLAERGIAVTGVTKATLGLPEVAGALLQAGVSALGDSRIENIEAMRRAGVQASMTLIRAPMLSQLDRVVEFADTSFNTELDVVSKLSCAARKAKRTHGILLMVELGDLREGIMPGDLAHSVGELLRFPNITLKGIGANLACRSGVSPDAENMGELSKLAGSLETKFGLKLDLVSGGNSANLEWALSGADTGRINDLRIGESILLGCEPLNRRPIEGLYTDAINLIVEVIESKAKPSLPWGRCAQTAFGAAPAGADRGCIVQTILAIGRQDTDPEGLYAPGVEILAASSDHLVVDAGRHACAVGAEIAFQVNYSALLRAMTSPFVARLMTRQTPRFASADRASPDSAMLRPNRSG